MNRLGYYSTGKGRRRMAIKVHRYGGGFFLFFFSMVKSAEGLRVCVCVYVRGGRDAYKKHISFAFG